MARLALTGARIFDGQRLAPGTLVIEAGRIAAILPPGAVADAEAQPLDGGILAPGFVDLQVNGGGGLMIDGAVSAERLATIAAAHARQGATAILPTLITDLPEATRAAIAATAEAIAQGVPGIAGLHLEGPHLSVARKGAHDPALIRPMDEADLALLCDAAATLPALIVTLAPESASPAQIARLSAAGATVSLGHSDADAATLAACVEAGARMVTHLFNAMSPLASREPGLVGTALDDGRLWAGLIADGVHVHPAVIRTALAAKRGPGAIFLVTDSMAPAGSDIAEFELGGRRILRRDGRLTLADGTLAGADLDMPRALRVLTGEVGVPLATALAMATARPAQAAGLAARHGHLAPGRPADIVHLADDLHLRGVMQEGHWLKA